MPFDLQLSEKANKAGRDHTPDSRGQRRAGTAESLGPVQFSERERAQWLCLQQMYRIAIRAFAHDPLASTVR